MGELTLISRLKLPAGYRVDRYSFPPTNAYRRMYHKALPFGRLYTIRNDLLRTDEYRVFFDDNPDVMYMGYDLQELMNRVVAAHRVMN